MVHSGEPYRTNAAIRVYRVGVSVVEKPGFRIERPRGSGDFDLIVFNSEADIELGGKSVAIKPGACILYSPDNPQFYGATHRPLEHDWFHFDGAGAALAVEHFGPPTNSLFHLRKPRWASELIQLIYWEAAMKPDQWDYAIEQHVRSLLLGVRRDVSSARAPSNAAEERVHAVRREILRAPERDWSVSALAHDAALSRSRFTALYRTCFGQPPKTDILHLRMHRARWLLLNTTNSVDNIARTVGFDNPAHFNRMFRKAFGTTPGRYRGSAG